MNFENIKVGDEVVFDREKIIEYFGDTGFYMELASGTPIVVVAIAHGFVGVLEFDDTIEDVLWVAEHRIQRHIPAETPTANTIDKRQLTHEYVDQCFEMAKKTNIEIASCQLFYRYAANLVAMRPELDMEDE